MSFALYDEYDREIQTMAFQRDNLIDVMPSTVPTFIPTTYTIKIAVNWEGLQEKQFWSSQLFVSHNARYALWAEGEIASHGLINFLEVCAPVNSEKRYHYRDWTGTQLLLF